ncbi:hypothetical protein QO239_23390 [Cupriavidus taiwanensis]|uniref:hypothetical protein n=1 Tax=Cupriavidus taiwanensis TaxID=164546 RepID=UPI00254233CE|nr:hypothetical protein [Cupriavidus taiwanensis]MDK3025543.1 hypothetical protein [Cupriavidus taiwanensis]
MSQQALADRIGASKTGLQANEAGKSVPGGQILASMYSLGISVDWLLSGEGEMLLSDARAGAHIPPSPLDVELLQVVLDRLEEKIAATGKRVSSKKKAELAALLYDYIVETGRAEGPSVERILRLVA